MRDRFLLVVVVAFVLLTIAQLCRGATIPTRRLAFRGGTLCTPGTNTLAVTVAAASVNTGQVGTYTTPAFTPSTNALLLAFITVSDANPIAAGEVVTNTGTTQLTWWRAARTNFNVVADPINFESLWVAQLPQGLAPFSMTVVCNPADAATGCAIEVVHVTGADQTAANGTNAIVQTTAFAVNASINPTNKWAAPGNGGFNSIIVGVASDETAVAPFLSWTEMYETNVSTPTSLLATYYSNNAPAILVTYTNDDNNANDWATIAVEVKAGTNCITAGSGIVQDVVSTSTSTDPSISHSQGALTSGYALVIAGYTFSAASSAATATYDGGAMTEIATFSQASFYHIKMFYRDLGTSGAGTKTVAVAHADAITSSLTTVVTFSGVQQGGGFTVGQNGNNTDDPVVLPLATTSANELVVGGIVINLAAANVAVTGTGTQLSEDDGSGLTYSTQKAPGTGGTVNLTWDLSTTAHGGWVGVVLKP